MSVKIIYRPIRPNDKKGFLKIRIIANRKTKIKTLGIKISEKNWLDDKQRVSKLEPNADKINEKIKEALKDLAVYDDPQQAIITANKTILEFYDSIIENTTNTGTRAKYTDIKNRFKSYLDGIGLMDLRLTQLNSDHVQAFYKYMRLNGCLTNTANYNIKSFKGIIKKAIKKGLVVYARDPFALMSLKFEPKKHKTLTAEEIKRIKETDFKETRVQRYNSLGVSLREVANTFLFQIFAQGIRVSDIQLLRWFNFSVSDSNIMLEYKQFKTKKNISLKLTPITLSLLENRLAKYDPKFIVSLDELKNKLNNLKNEYINFEKEKDQLNIQKELDEGMKYKNMEEYNIRSIERKAKEGNNLMWELSLNSKFNDINKKIYKTYADIIERLSYGDNSEDYVFYFFENDEVMKEYKEGLIMSDKQYTRLQGKRAYYNNLLKEIQKQTGIKTTITSHLARHTYTQLILNNKADIISVSKALGHSHISTTQTYISQFPNAKLLDINDSISNDFS